MVNSPNPKIIFYAIADCQTRKESNLRKAKLSEISERFHLSADREKRTMIHL